MPLMQILTWSELICKKEKNGLTAPKRVTDSLFNNIFILNAGEQPARKVKGSFPSCIKLPRLVSQSLKSPYML